MTFAATKPYISEKTKKEPAFYWKVAETDNEIDECLSLRYAVFAGEMGARLTPNDSNIDKDRFDPYCKHLMVIDSKTQKVIATTRLLMDDDANKVGAYYSETEFDISNILSQDGSFMEVGRTCIHPYHRKGSVLAILWQGIAWIITQNNIDFLFGCGSISLRNGDTYVNSVMHCLRHKHFSPESLRARPRIPLPRNGAPTTEDVVLPTLLKGYLRQGAMICGEPHWDAEFQVADVFILLKCNNITHRYQRHFINKF